MLRDCRETWAEIQNRSLCNRGQCQTLDDALALITSGELSWAWASDSWNFVTGCGVITGGIVLRGTAGADTCGVLGCTWTFGSDRDLAQLAESLWAAYCLKAALELIPAAVPGRLTRIRIL